MAKVIGKNKDYIYQDTCHNCASIVEYTKSETVRKSWSDYSGDSGYYNTLNCPNCGKEMEV